MLQTNHQLRVPSLRAKAAFGDFMSIRSSKNTGVSQTVKFGEHSRPISICEGPAVDDQLKVVKLIGNQNQNIEEILDGLRCHCGCRAEFKKILTLLMGKIYKLREERNELRQHLKEQRGEGKERGKEGKEGGVGVGVNTEEDLQQEQMQEELFKLINDSKMKSMPSEILEPAVEVSPLPTENIFGTIINR